MSLAEAADNWFPFGYLLKAITLATEMNSLARYSKRTIQPRKAVSLYHY